ncbi:MAG: hypothetical protein GY951_03705 [Psychromonas sp.]|nr:hypothetical protein [Alteromonadales bacterium]MCP5077145.1 hypothetical protein [Psychromonas sp.]
MKRKFSFYVLPVMASCVLSSTLYAQEESNENDQLVDHLFGGVSIDYSRNAFKDSSYKANRSAGMNLRLGYKNDNNLRMMLSGGASYRLDGEEGLFTNDYWFSVGKSDIFQPTSWLTIGADGRIALPISEFSRKTELNTAIRGAVSFNFNLENSLKGLRFTFQPRLKANFHEYKTAGNVNLTQYSASTLYALNYGYEKWSFGITAINTHNWTYKGTYKTPNLTHIEHIGYQISDNWNVGIGHTNSTNFFDPDRGPSPESQIFDVKSSTFYGTLIYSF